MEKAKEMLLSTGTLALKVTPRARIEGLEGLNTAGELVVAELVEAGPPPSTLPAVINPTNAKAPG